MSPGAELPLSDCMAALATEQTCGRHVDCVGRVKLDASNMHLRTFQWRKSARRSNGHHGQTVCLCDSCSRWFFVQAPRTHVKIFQLPCSCHHQSMNTIKRCSPTGRATLVAGTCACHLSHQCASILLLCWQNSTWEHLAGSDWLLPPHVSLCLYKHLMPITCQLYYSHTHSINHLTRLSCNTR